VLYRLDGGVDHILVDEAQDTSPEQWRVIELLAQEFTAGQGARCRADDLRRRRQEAVDLFLSGRGPARL
jgi:ATP-dependent exoDNAse (exonuclease V) beta subunit